MTSTAVSRKPPAPARAALTLIESRLPADSFLLAQFEDFYREVVACKSDPIAGPDDVRERLLAFLQRQEDDASRVTTLLGIEMYRQAQRVMACMADEIFAGTPGQSQHTWKSLETELFEAQQPFGLALDGPCMKKLDLLLQQDDPAYRELATVYFYALALTPTREDARLRYSRPLLEMIGGNDGRTREGGHVFAQTYAHTLAENKLTALPSARRWWLALGLIVLAWISISGFLWNQLIAPLESELQKIHRQTQGR